MKNIRNILLILAMVAMSAQTHAVNTLQVGAYAGDGDVGTYADYIASSSDPTEEDTAVTDSTSILFAGMFGPNTINLGGQYPGGDDYSDINSALSFFDGHGAIVMASVADGADASALTVDGDSAFHTSSILNGLFPNDHDPLKDGISDFLFFDIGEFQKLANQVVNFDESEPDAFDGEIKELTIAGLTGLDWIHFDLMALETNLLGDVKLKTSWGFNPGSHDVTWKRVPEPTIVALLGIGLVGFGLRGLNRKRIA